MSPPQSVELLEARLVMTVPTPPIDLTTATSDAATAQAALTIAQNNFVTTMTGLENTLSGDYVAHANTADSAMDSAGTAFDSAIDGISTALAGVIAGLTSGFESQVDTRAGTLDGAIDGINTSFSGALSGLTSTLTGALAGAQSLLDGGVAGADGVLDAAVNGAGGFRSVLDGIVSAAQTLFQTNVAGINTAFDGFVTGQVAVYDGQELGFWNSYLTATDSSPTGLQGIYNAAIASAAATRDSVLVLYPNVTYYPSILEGTTAYDSLINGANDTLNNDLTTATNTFNTNVQGHQDTFDNAISGPSGAMVTYAGLMVPVDAGLDTAITAADTIYDGAIDAAQIIYNTIVNDPGGLIDNFQTSVTGYQTAYDGAVQVAQGIFEGLVSAAETAYDGAVTAAEIAYQNWLTSNPFVPAMQNRVTALDTQLTILRNQLTTVLTGLQTTAGGSIATANTTYDNLANAPGIGFVYQFNNAVTAAGGTATSNADQDWTTYQGQYDSFMLANMIAMMNAMLNNLPPPPTNMGPILIDTQNYALELAGEEISYTASVGGAFVAYVGAERAADTARDQSVIGAINTYLQNAISAVDAWQTNALAEIKDCLDDLTDLEAGFATADVGKQVTKSNSINDAEQARALAGNAADEGFTVAESNAALVLAQSIAADVEPLRNGEMGARISFGQAAATAAEAWDNARGLAVQTWTNGAASASNQYTVLATNAAETLQVDLLGDSTTLTSDTSVAFQTWVSTVSSGVASQWATYVGGGADVTAVANAWATYAQNAVSAWANFSNGEAGAFQAYGGQEASAHKTGNQTLSAQNVVRIGQVAGEVVTADSSVAGGINGFEQRTWSAMAPWMASVAGVEHTANNLASGAGNAFELGLAPQVHSAWDGVANAFHGYFGGVLSDFLPYAQNVITQEQSAGHSNVTQIDVLLNAARTAGTQYAQSNRGSWNSFANSAAGAEDGVVVAAATDRKSQAVLGAVNHYSDLVALPPSALESQVGQQQSFAPTGAGMLLSLMNDDAAISLAATTPSAPESLQRYATIASKPTTFACHLPSNIFGTSRLSDFTGLPASATPLVRRAPRRQFELSAPTRANIELNNRIDAEKQRYAHHMQDAASAPPDLAGSLAIMHTTFHQREMAKIMGNTDAAMMANLMLMGQVAGHGLIAMGAVSSAISPRLSLAEIQALNTPSVIDPVINIHQINAIGASVEAWLGSNATVITNAAGDRIFQSSNGMREVRFDFNHTFPHLNRHMHLIEYEMVKNMKKKLFDLRICPLGVDPE